MKFNPAVTLFFVIALVIASCSKDKIKEDIGSLAFSTDTVIFDTVFTQTGTATRNFKIYNNSGNTLKINSIYLANPNSQFRINVNGEAGKSFKDIEILPHDSMFVFVDATINPNGLNSPLIVSDSVIFVSNGAQKDVDLVAWGQDAIYLKADTAIQGIAPRLKIIRSNQVWNNFKPIVIYGYVVFDSAYSLTIEAGTKIYFHGGSGLWIYKGATIKVNGTKDQPVIFQGDRLEAAYKDLPGQWDRIWIWEGDNASQKSEFNYAIIKNGLIGLQAETDPFNPQTPTSPNKLVLNNCIIQNHSALGLYLRNYKVDANNVLVSNAGQYCIGITVGGEYNFDQVTVANYFGSASRKTPGFFMSNAGEIAGGGKLIGNIVNSSFKNCIVYGNQETEFDYSFENTGTVNFSFDHSLIKRKDAISDSRFTNLIYNKDPKFKDQNNFDFHLLQNSPAINAGINTFNPFTGTDLDNVSRTGNPDLGAYEFK